MQAVLGKIDNLNKKIEEDQSSNEAKVNNLI